MLRRLLRFVCTDPMRSTAGIAAEPVSVMPADRVVLLRLQPVLPRRGAPDNVDARKARTGGM